MTAQLFTPVEVGGVTLPNRVVVSPMCQYSSVDGSAQPWHQVHYGMLSMSGAGLLCFEATHVEREGRITEINGFRIEAAPRGRMLVMHNRDVPGVIGRVGTILGEQGINISAFHLGRRERGGEAMAVIEIDAGAERGHQA